jgi:hypothetical protein
VGDGVIVKIIVNMGVGNDPVAVTEGLGVNETALLELGKLDGLS